MSNLSKFIKKGGKKGDGPVEPVAPKPGAMPPLVDTSARTRQVDLSGVAKADAEQAQEDEVTLEVSGKAPPLYPSEPPKPVPPASVPGAKVVPISLAKQPAGEAEAAAEAEAEPPAPAAPAAPDGAKNLLDRIKQTVEGLLAPIKERLEKLEADAEEQKAMTSDIGVAIDGPSPDAPDEEKVDAEGKPVVGLSGQVAGLRAALDELRTQLLGENPAETLDSFGGGPVAPLLFEQAMETAGYVNELVGKNGERIPSIVNKTTLVDAKAFVIELQKERPGLAKVMRAAVECGPDTAKDILAALGAPSAGGSEDYAVMAVGAVELAPSECLDDPANADAKAKVLGKVKDIAPKAQWCHDAFEWDRLEQFGVEYRAGELEWSTLDKYAAEFSARISEQK